MDDLQEARPSPWGYRVIAVDQTVRVNVRRSTWRPAFQGQSQWWKV